MPDMVEAGSAHRSGTKLESCPRDSAPGAWGALHAQPPAAYRLARMRNGVDANSRRPENHSKSPYFSGDYGPVRSLVWFFWFFCFQVQTPNTKYFSIYFFETTDLSVSRPIFTGGFPIPTLLSFSTRAVLRHDAKFSRLYAGRVKLRTCP